MVYPAAFLPARSWRKLLDNLPNHFGEDASLEPTTAGAISDYLAAHAADTPDGDSDFLRGVAPTDAPLRISETPFWINIHSAQVRAEDFADPSVLTKSNCIGCHTLSDHPQ
jgi:hypothetical protein